MNIQNDLVSIIIPTYGRSSTLTAAINSVLEQEHQNLEVIVVNDNDNIEIIKSVEEILKIFEGNKKVKYFSDGVNRGGSGARNKGIEISSGYYISFLDDDDTYLKSKISKQLDFLVKNQLDACACDMFFLQDNKFHDVNNCIANVDSLKEFILAGNCYTPMLFCKKEILLAVNGFTDTPRFQDHILLLKILAYTDSIKRLPEKLFIHNFHNGERITYSTRSIEAFQIREKYERENLNVLNDHEIAIFEFKKAIINMRIAGLTNNKKDFLIKLYSAIKYIRRIDDVVVIFKCISRVLILPNKRM